MIAINKAYFYQLLDEYYRKKYKKTNKTKNVCRLSIELDVSPTTIYNFIGGYNFNRGLLESIVKTLNINTEELHKLVRLYGMNR